MFMFMEKLACFDMAPEEVFKRMEAAWKEHGFFKQMSYKRLGSMVFGSRTEDKLRVDVKTNCIPEGTGTVVQMIYSPAVTPVTVRPVKLTKHAESKLQSGVKQDMLMVLNAVGDWKSITREEIQDHPELLEDASNIQATPQSVLNRTMIFLGLGIIALGVAFYLLDYFKLMTFGSSTLWLDAVLVGAGFVILAFLRKIRDK